MPDVLERGAEARGGDDRGDLMSKALMGAAAGAVGTWALDRADWRMWNHESADARLRTTSVRPFGEPPAQVLVRKAEQQFGLRLSPQQHELAGTFVHYGIGIGPAVVYSMVRHTIPVPGPARGLLYGLTLFLLQDEGLNAATGLGANPRQYPWQAHARGLVSHLVYGLVTEMALSFMDQLFQRENGPRPQRSR